MLKSTGLVNKGICTLESAAIKQNFIALYTSTQVFKIHFLCTFSAYYVLLTLKGIHNMLLNGKNKLKTIIIT